MPLSQLSITNFRNLSKVELHPLTQGFNFFYGLNGSGKTSLLEAIYYLGHKRSFRCINSDRLIRYHSEQFHIFSKLITQSKPQSTWIPAESQKSSSRVSADGIKSELPPPAAKHVPSSFGEGCSEFAMTALEGITVPLGMEHFQSGECRIRLSGRDIDTISELAYFLPIRLINVHSHYLLEGGPIFRRKFLDWGIFYQNPEFHVLWLRFKRLLKQRNAALKMHASLQELSHWTQQLIEISLSFNNLRISYVEQLLPIMNSLFQEILSEILDVSPLKIDYYPGWNTSYPYEEIIKTAQPKDLERGYTQFGPHRADLRVTFNHILAKDVLSTGQQKLLVCGMILAQGALLAKLANKKPIYLIDDLPSELDLQSRSWLIRALAKQCADQRGAQVFVTAVEQETMSEILAEIDMPVKMFHVKHGEIQEV